jgi:GT2 family glycosyltransferase
MKIASITPTYNSFHYLPYYKNNAQTYIDDIYLHIIVDNNSNDLYKQRLRKLFSNSILILRKANGGTTAAFNEGIRYAIAHGADAILLITQDMKLEKGSLKNLYNCLFISNKTGVVGPILLKKNNSSIIESFGGRLNRFLEVIFYYRNQNYSTNNIPNNLEVDFICGGVNLSKTEVYEKVGLQDEKMFMYGDEIDWDYRVKKKGYKLIVTKDALAWHEHLGEHTNSKLAIFLSARNAFYLVRKHTDIFNLILFTFNQIIRTPRIIFRPLVKLNFTFLNAYFWGTLCGIFNVINNSKFLNKK